MGVVVRTICGWLVLALLGGGCSLAQQSDATGSQQQSQQSQQDQNPQQEPPPAQSPDAPPPGNENPSAQTYGSGVPQGPLPAGSAVGAFREFGIARDVLLEKGPVRFGPIFVPRASGFFLAGNGLQYDQNTNTVIYATNTAGVLTANIDYAREGRHTSLLIDYNPQLAVVEGVSENDFQTGSVTVGAGYQFGHRWSWSIHDTAATSNRHLITGDFLASVNAVSGETTNNSFLVLPTRTVSDTLQNTFSYLISPRDRLDMEFTYTYLDSPYNGADTTSNSIGGRIAWNHALSRDQAIGLSYSIEKRYFSAVFPDTLYQQVGGSYSITIDPTLQLHATAGIGRADDNLNGISWTGVGEVGLLKKTQRHLFTLGYYRGTTILPVQTNQFVDRIDVADTYQLTDRWVVHGAFGKQRSGGGTIETLSGTYANVQVTFHLGPLLSWITSYSHIWQPGNTTLPGYSYFSTGLQFSANRNLGGY